MEAVPNSQPVVTQPPVYYNPPAPTAEELMNKEAYRSLTMEASIALKGMKEVKGMLSEFGVPFDSPVVKMCWGFLTDESVKTTIDEKQYRLLMMDWRAYKCKVIDWLAGLDSLPSAAGKIQGPGTYAMYRHDIDNVARVIEVRGRRALNGFERRMLITSSSESVSSQTSLFNDQSRQQQPGFLKRFLGIGR